MILPFRMLHPGSGIPDLLRFHMSRVRTRILIILLAGAFLHTIFLRITGNPYIPDLKALYLTRTSDPTNLHGLTFWNSGVFREHPIQQLIEQGRRRHEVQAQKLQEVNSVAAAVADYREAFEMDPPEGFDAWFNLAVSLNATWVPSLLPHAHKSVLPFLAMPPRLLRQRARDILKVDGSLGIALDPLASAWHQRVKVIETDWVSKGRFWAWESEPLLAPYLHLFPESDPPLVLPVWSEDNSFRVPHGDIIERSVELAKNGLGQKRNPHLLTLVWEEQDLLAAESAALGVKGWRQACPSSLGASLELPTDVVTSRTEFVSNAVDYADICFHPELFHLNGELIMEERSPFKRWDPLFVPSQLHRGGEILATPSYQMNETTQLIPWHKKTEDKLFFRGGVSGIFHSDLFDWRSGQRDRLAFMSDPARASLKNSSVLVPCAEEDCQGWHRQTYNMSNLVGQYFDVGIVPNTLGWMCGLDGAFMEMCMPNREDTENCPPPGDRGCEEMKREIPWTDYVQFGDTLKYKYALDVDGFGWTARWRRQLSTGSVILKASIYPEWWTPQIIPYYHYIPIKYDYSDVFDIMSFFAGAPGTRKGGRDDLAKDIGEHGREFAMKRLRWEDLQSYMFLLVLEFRRAWMDDRRKATFDHST